MQAIRKMGIILLFVWAAVFTAVPAFAGVPGQISYQGRLTDGAGNLLPDDTYAITFSLYNASDTLLWSETQNDVLAIGGIFNVQIGQDPIENPFPAFDGEMFLGIKVGSDAEMEPRQAISSVPFAIKAADADRLEGQNASQFAAVIHGHGWEEIGGIPGGFADGIDDTGILSETDPTVPESVKDGTSWTEILSRPAGLDDGDDVGITSWNDIQDMPAGFADGTDDVGGITSETDPQVGDIKRFYVPIWNGSELTSGAMYNALFLPDGWRVGIGTESPQSRLHVNAAHDADGLILGPPTTEWAGETYRMRLRNFFGDGFLQTASGGPQFLLSYNSYRSNDGTWNATNSANQSAMVNLSPGTIRFQTGTAAATPEVTTHMKIQSDGAVIIGPDAKHLSMWTSGTLVDIASVGSGLAINYSGDTSTFLNVAGGKVGIGTGTPAFGKLHVFTNENNNAIYGVSTGTGAGMYAVSTSAETGYHGMVGISRSNNPLHAGILAENTGAGPGLVAKAGNEGYAAILDGNLLVRSTIDGSNIVELGEGLDYAEGFDVSGIEKPLPGSVLIIDPENPGKLKISNRAYDTKVAGIVAGANSLGSGVRLGAGKFDNDVALAGRVYCNVDASYGEVNPGDLLTTAPTTGCAMKVGDYSRSQGAILGKAMQGLAEGQKGQILVLVTLQ